MNVLFCIWVAVAVAEAAQAPGAAGELQIVVVDPSGAVVAGATIAAQRADRSADAISTKTDGQGRARIDLAAGRYDVTVAAAGFETAVTRRVEVKRGAREERRVVLAMARLFEDITVTSTDRVRDAFSGVLSAGELARLPDDPDLMEAALREMAGPGDVTIRVDGFTGIALPRRSEIQSIRFRRDEFSAENHARGAVRVDITTRPGAGALRGSVGSIFHDAAWDARNAFVPERAPARFEQHDLQVNGPLWPGHTSFRASLTSSRDTTTRPILASTGAGTLADQVRQPVRFFSASAQVRQALPGAHLLRTYVDRTWSMKSNLGVGGFSLPERAYASEQHGWAWMVSETGPIGRRLFSDLRLQLRHDENAVDAAHDAPAIVVLDAFQAGGAQIGGGRSTTHLELAHDVDFTLGGRQAIRAGLLVDHHHTRSDERRNAGGTFTFSGLEDFLSGRPAVYTRRDGDPRVELGQTEAGWYIQDDVRLGASWMLTAGVRNELQGHVGGWLHPAPRAGMTWASSGTSVYVGGGFFYDWLTAETYEQVLRVDGRSQWDLVILQPGYPNPESGSRPEFLPRSRYQLAPDLRLPRIARAAARVRQRVNGSLQLMASLGIERSGSRLRGLDVNTPGAAGARPDPQLGIVTAIDSIGRSLSRTAAISLNATLGKSWSTTLTYQAGGAWNEADDPFALPADSANPHGDWGPSRLDVRHRLSGYVHASPLKTLWIDARVNVSSAPPYTITTGHDDNGDGLLNDRPSGFTRNSARGSLQRTAAARISWRFGVGPPATDATIVTTRSGGDINTFITTPGVTKRFTMVLFVDAQNLLNTVNYVSYSGVLTSPFFGRPTAALSPRQVQAGIQFVF